MADGRRKTQKRYLRSVNMTFGLNTGADVVGLCMEVAEITMMAISVGAVPDIVLSAWVRGDSL